MPNGLDMKVDVSMVDPARVAKAIREKLRATFMDGVDGIVRDAKKLSPYEDGTNRRSIDKEVKNTAVGVTAEVFTTSGYGGWLEIGSGQRRSKREQIMGLRGTGGPTPYIRPAYELNKMGILEALRNCLK